MTEEEYRELEPLYERAKQEIPTWGSITISNVQRHYRLGYNRAQRMLEALVEAGVLRWNHVTGAYTPAVRNEGSQQRA